MEIIYGIRNGVKGRFNEQSWPIAERAGWKAVTEENDVNEPPVEVITFLRDQPLADIHVKAIDFAEPEPETFEEPAIVEQDKQNEVEAIEEPDNEPEHPIKKINKPRGRAKSKK